MHLHWTCTINLRRKVTLAGFLSTKQRWKVVKPVSNEHTFCYLVCFGDQRIKVNIGAPICQLAYMCSSLSVS